MRHFNKIVFPRQAVNTFKWFFNDFVLRFKKSILLVALSGFGSATIQAGLLFLINSFVNQSKIALKIESVFSLWLPEFRLDIFLAIAVFLALITSSSLVFLQSRITLGLWKRYQIHTCNNLLDQVAIASARGIIDKDLVNQSAIPRVLTTTQRLGAFTRILCNSISPFLRFIALAFFAATMQPSLTITVLATAAIFGGFVLLIFARDASRQDTNMGNYAYESSLDITQRLQNAVQQKSFRIQLDSTTERSAHVRKIDHLLASLLSMDKSRLAGMILTVGLLLAVIFVSGHSFELNSETWGGILLYFMSLMLALMQLVILGHVATNFARFYPTIYKYKKLLEILNSADSKEMVTADLKKNGLFTKQGYDNNIEELIA